MKVILVLFAIVLVSQNIKIYALDCSVDVSKRIDCGHMGTDKASCEASSCCWDPQNIQFLLKSPTNLKDTPWCFKSNDAPKPPTPPTPPAGNCNVSVSERRDCGAGGTDQDKCEAKGCCWTPVNAFESNKLAGTPWCYYNSDTPDSCKKFNWKTDEVGFDDAFLAKVKEQYMNNINVDGVGAVVASRDQGTPGGSYFYHWMRDAALTMKTYLEINDYDYDTVKDIFRKYVSWVKNVQNKPDSNVDVRVEAKFEIPSGDPYNGGWCRPQTDGPGLRANSLSLWGWILTKQGLIPEAQEVFELVKKDLEWVTSNWQSNGCDLWEEFRSTDFFWGKSGFVQGLETAAVLAGVLKDTTTESAYTSAANTVRQNILQTHFNGNYIFEANGRDIDGAVIHAIASFGETIWKPSSEQVAKTLQVFTTAFCHEYSLNQKDNESGLPGVLIGRYQNDSYAGGNPWPLLTAVLAETFYLSAKDFYSRSDNTLLKDSSDAGVKEYMKLLNMEDSNGTLRNLGDAAVQAGDAVMNRMWTYLKNDDGRIDEQIDRDTGAQKSAKQLTWSHANILHVMHTRKQVVAKYGQPIAQDK